MRQPGLRSSFGRPVPVVRTYQDAVGVARVWEGDHHLCVPTRPRTTPLQKRCASCAQNTRKKPVDGANKQSAGGGESPWGEAVQPLPLVALRLSQYACSGVPTETR